MKGTMPLAIGARNAPCACHVSGTEYAAHAPLKACYRRGSGIVGPWGGVGTRRQRGHPWHEMHEVTMPCAYPRGLHKLADRKSVV